MTMSLISALPTPVDLAAWDDDWSEREENYELVRGFPAMVPAEVPGNAWAQMMIGRIVTDATHDAFRAYPQIDILLGGDPPTIRRPDVTVAARGRLAGARRALPGDVALVVEVVSPSSVETDWLTKRAEYAAVGIPAYLVIDLRGETPRLALFEQIVDGAYTDPTHLASGATLALGEFRILVRLADLLDT